VHPGLATLRASVTGAFVVLAVLPAQGQDHARWVTTTLAVRGNVATLLTMSVAELRKFPVQRVEDARVVSGNTGESTVTRKLAGCLLRDVLTSAKLTERERLDLRRTVVVASASDGYKVVFSWAELFNSPIGDGVLVVYERDGAPLPDDEGRIALVSLKDIRPGPRHVKWLQGVEVVRVAD
jgi:DMSO/TMAO reductase YedYZ molybdopterin-dependent catalytic subunit